MLDLGANVGYFALRVTDLIRQEHPGTHVEISMVEGSSRVFADLKARMESQPLPELSSRLVHGLVGARTGAASMRESAVHVKNTIMYDAGTRGPKTQFLDLSVLMENTDEIDLLKCDIEGAELLFLENYAELLGKVRSAVFELHHEQCDTLKCREILKKNGFRETVLRDTPTFSVNFMTRD